MSRLRVHPESHLVSRIGWLRAALLGDQAIGRSKGGLSSKIHAMVDALGHPIEFVLSPGQAHDLEGTDARLPQMKADTLLADKAYDADERVIEPCLQQEKIP